FKDSTRPKSTLHSSSTLTEMPSSGNGGSSSGSLHHRKRKSRRHSGGSGSAAPKVCPVCETLLPADSRHRQPEDHILDLLRSVFTRGASQSFYHHALQIHWDSFFMAMPADFPLPYCRLCCMHLPGFVPFAHHLCHRASLIVDTKTDRLHTELLGHFVVFLAGVGNPALELRLQAERAGEFLCRRCQPGIEKLQLKSAAAKAAAAANRSAATAATAVTSSSDFAVKLEPTGTPSVLLPPPAQPEQQQQEQQQEQQQHSSYQTPAGSATAVGFADIKMPSMPARQRLLFRNRSSMLMCGVCQTGIDNLAAHLLTVLRSLKPPADQRSRNRVVSGTTRSALAEYRRSHVSQLIGDCVSTRIERYNIMRTVFMCPACQLHFHSPSSFYTYFFNHLARNYREDQPEQAHTILMHRIVALLIDYVADRVSIDEVEQFFFGGSNKTGDCGFFCDAGGLELRHVRNGTGICVGQQRITDFAVDWIAPAGFSTDGLTAAASVWRSRSSSATSLVVPDSPTATDATIIVPNNADVVCQYCGAGFSGRHHLSALHNHLLRALFLGSCEEEAGDLPGAAETSQRRHRLCWSAFAPAARPARCTACGKICGSLELLAEHIGDKILSTGSASHHAVAEDIAEMLMDVATGRAAHERACGYMENFLLLNDKSVDGCDDDDEFPASASAISTKPV
ncbi:hypothetical protein BOX15_Mlig020389g1, partial [Macrostomum lignano]